MLFWPVFVSNQSCCSTMELVINGNVDPGYNLEMLPKDFSYFSYYDFYYGLCSSNIPFYDGTELDEASAFCVPYLQRNQTVRSTLPQGNILYDTRYNSKSFYRQFDGYDISINDREFIIFMQSTWIENGENLYFYGGSVLFTTFRQTELNYTYVIQASEFDCGVDNVNITFTDMPDNPISGSSAAKNLAFPRPRPPCPLQPRPRTPRTYPLL